MNFIKMQATGNDFIIIEGEGMERDWPSMAKALCHRRFGVGADGLLLVLPSEAAHFRMRIFNADGSEAEMCGNGIRCFTKYVIERRLAHPTSEELTIETLAGVRTVHPEVVAGRVVSVGVGMGVPRFRARDIPMALDRDLVMDYPLRINGREIEVTCLSMGNPHAVHFSNGAVEDFPLAEVGPKVEKHALFPDRVNFEVAHVISSREIGARVWERGVGETLACGTGACAVMVAARIHGWVGHLVDIISSGGVLSLGWDGVGEVWLRGPVETVFWGEWVE